MPEAPQALRGFDVFKLHKLIGKVSAVVSQANVSNFLGSHPTNENQVGPHGSLGGSPLYMGRLELVDKGSSFASRANVSILVGSLPTN